MRATSPPSVATSVEGTFFFKFVTKKSCRSLSDPILIVFAFTFFLVITADWVEERRYSHVGNKRSFQCCCSSQHQGLMCSVYGLTLGLHNTSTVNYGCFWKAMLHDTFRFEPPFESSFELFNAMFCGKFTSERSGRRRRRRFIFPEIKNFIPLEKS